jgi:hypothetical protein
MSRKHLATTAWLLVSTATFGLGWILKPVPLPSDTDASSHSQGANLLDSTVSPLTATKRSSHASEDESGPQDRLLAASQVLSSADIDALGKQFKTELDPIARRVAFGKLLAGLTLENATEIRAQIADMPDSSPEFLEFHYAWGKIGGVDAVLKGMDTRERDMGATLAGWASANPAEAMKWFDSLGQTGDTPNNRSYLREGMVHGLANTDPDLASRFVLDLAASGDKDAGRLLDVITTKVIQSRGTVSAAAWAENLSPGEMRSSAIGRVAQDYARNDPAQAAAWATQFVDTDDGRRVVSAISREWASRDGAAAVNWLQSLESSPSTSKAYYSAFEGWAARDPLAASTYLVEMAQSPSRDQAINGLVSRHRWEDPLASIAWAGQITDPETRVDSLVRAGQAYFRRDPGAASTWLASSGLPADAQQKIIGKQR